MSTRQDPVIAANVAEEMLSGWEAEIGTILAADSRAKILHAIEGGRLDWTGSSFAYRLLAPIAKDGGTTLDALEICEPSAGQLMDASKATNDMDQALRLLSMVSGQPLALVQKIKERDLIIASGLLGFFA